MQDRRRLARRLTVANQEGFEQNVYFSRQGTPTDWLFGQDDAGSAVALNAGTAGHIGQPVYCLIPARDDLLIIGCDASIHALVGDPAADGTLSIVSDSIGMYGQEAWCMDPAGVIYFVGTGGFYRMKGAGQAPQNLSVGAVAQFFKDLDRWRSSSPARGTATATAAGSSPASPTARGRRASGGTSGRAGSSPCSSPTSRGRPPAWSTTATPQRPPPAGRRVGRLPAQLSEAAADDDGTPIASYVVIGPVQPAGIYNETMLMGWECVLGQLPSSLTIDVYGGEDAPAASARCSAR